MVNYINSHIIDIDEKSNRETSLFISMISERFDIGKDDIDLDCDVLIVKLENYYMKFRI